MFQSKIDARGRTTVPAAIRKALHASPGTRLMWHVMLGGRVLVQVKSMSVLELAGILKPGVSVDADDMNPWHD